MRTESEVLEVLKRWAEPQANVRTVLLTGSRADPRRQPDRLADYDVEVFVRDVRPFIENDAWVSHFGPVMVRWPRTPQPTFSADWITQLVLYQDGLRIDFQITTLAPGASENLDSGYRVVVDKDKVAAHLPEPTYTRELLGLPTAQAFADRLNAFWWDIVYVAKGLHRGELNYAKAMLDGTIRFDKLQPLLEWHIGLHHDWSVDPGLYGRWFHKYLEPGLWHSYTQTFAGAEFADNWRALLATLDLVRQVGRSLAGALGFEYPAETDRQVTAYIEWIRALAR
ncbi:MAG TPA: aminoglycoside 6-adenylyltransferase [Anaerolineae bacterium]|nr:aminoglycoside 6-adenylyltransferase [Anaerolineae bacterium]